MPRRTRGLLLDLDDTLYPYRRFLLSGFAAVARHVSRQAEVPEADAFRTLIAAYRGQGRGRELDHLQRTHDLAVPVAEMVQVIRTHRPLMRLHPATVDILRQLRRSWRLAIVTNGQPAIQSIKVDALGLTGLVDTVVYAAEHGSGAGKPERDPFLEALRRLDVRSTHALFVGDDERTDMQGASACGLRTIKTRQWRREPHSAAPTCADATVRHIADVPGVAERLLPKEQTHYAA